MKKYLRLFILFALLCWGTGLYAQGPFSTMDSVDINNINAAVLVHGDMWWNPLTGIRHCNFPADSITNLSGPGAIWMSGYDAASQLHVAAQTYRQTGNDYWPGPLDAGGSLSYVTSQNWAYIWKVNRSDIQYFQALSTHTVANTPPAILTWPANGNTYAQGNGGAPLTITTDMAPFVDLNGDGIYEPLLGEYPDVNGDQALWWVFSDNGPTHNQTNGRPLSVEVHALAYAYNRGTLIDNVIYYEYTIVNRSANNYTDFRIAQWEKVLLGSDYLDDFIGFDSVWRMGIIYKGNNNDGLIGGDPPGSYGPYPPKSAVTMIDLPGDAGSSYVPVGCFNYYNNDESYIGNPVVDTEYNNIMRAESTRGGWHLHDDFMGAGIPTTGYGPGPNCNYVFPGDPDDTTEWSECNCNNNPGDRMSVLSSNDFSLNAGASQKVVFALLTTNRRDGGCPEASFDSISVVADTAWGVYANPLPPLPAGFTNIAVGGTTSLYPNPSDGSFTFNLSSGISEQVSILITNIVGEKMDEITTATNTPINIHIDAPPGVYFLTAITANGRWNDKFVINNSGN